MSTSGQNNGLCDKYMDYIPLRSTIPCIAINHSIISLYSLAWEKSWHLAMPPLVSPRNDVWGTRAEVTYWRYTTTHIWVVLLIGRSCRRNIALTNQKRKPDLGCDKSAVWNFCSRLLDVISRRNQWWHQEMSTVFSGSLFSYPANFWYNGINSISTGRRILAFSTIRVKSGSSSEFPNNELRATWVFPNTASRTHRLNSPGSW